MTWEMWVLVAIAAYITCGLVWSTGLRCWWRGQHDTIRMSVPDHEEYRKTVRHCRWCGHREAVIWESEWKALSRVENI